MGKQRIVTIAIAAVLTLAADQVTKQIARRSLRDKAPVEVIAGYLAFEYHENPGVAFSVGRNWPGGRFIFIGIGIVALYLVWRLVRQVERRARVAHAAFGLIVGGAVGNFVDRLYIGRVVDFIVMHWQRKAQWPAYNVADAALVAGVILLILVMGGSKERAPAAAGGKRGKRKAR